MNLIKYTFLIASFLLFLIKNSFACEIKARVSVVGNEFPAIQTVGAGAKKCKGAEVKTNLTCLLYTSPSPRDQSGSRMPSSA